MTIGYDYFKNTQKYQEIFSDQANCPYVSSGPSGDHQAKTLTCSLPLNKEYLFSLVGLWWAYVIVILIGESPTTKKKP